MATPTPRDESGWHREIAGRDDLILDIDEEGIVRLTDESDDFILLGDSVEVIDNLIEALQEAKARLSQ